MRTALATHAARPDALNKNMRQWKDQSSHRHAPGPPPGSRWLRRLGALHSNWPPIGRGQRRGHKAATAAMIALVGREVKWRRRHGFGSLVGHAGVWSGASVKGLERASEIDVCGRRWKELNVDRLFRAETNRQVTSEEERVRATQHHRPQSFPQITACSWNATISAAVFMRFSSCC